MAIVGIEGWTRTEVEEAVAAGGRFVCFEYCISLLVVTLRQPTEVCFLRQGEWGVLVGFPWTLVSLALGWWGLPWGVIYTPLTLITNLCGGCNVTAQVLDHLRQQEG